MGTDDNNDLRRRIPSNEHEHDIPSTSKSSLFSEKTRKYYHAGTTTKTTNLSFFVMMIVALLAIIFVIKTVVLFLHTPTTTPHAFPSPDLSMFDRCRDPTNQQTEGENDGALCVFFRPLDYYYSQQLQQRQQQPEEPILRLQDIRWDSFAFQASNFGEGPPLRWNTNKNDASYSFFYNSYSQGGDGAVESVSILAAPKCGSRSLYELFMNHIAMTGQQQEQKQHEQLKQQPSRGSRSRTKNSNSIWNRVGKVNPRFVMELVVRQQQDEEKFNPVEVFIRRHYRDVVLSVIRDPISRFVSSVTQLISMMGRKSCGPSCKLYLEPCFIVNGNDNLNPNQVLYCVAQSVSKHGFWNEHLVPWIHFVRIPLHNQNVQVAVMSMDQMDSVLMKSFITVGGTAGTEDSGNEKAGIIHANKFDNQKLMSVQSETYRDLVYQMQNLVKQQQLSDSLIKELCRLYQMDVKVMRYLGFSVEYC